MRALVLSLFLLNLALFGWLRGMFGVFPSAGREPGRLDQQIAPDRVRVLTDREVQQLRRRANETSATPPAVAPTPVAPAPDFAGACVEIGDFSGDGVLPRLREKLTELRLTDHASEQIVELPGWYLVFVPPAKSRAQAERRAEELRAQGVRDVLVILGNGPLRFAISLGSFRDPDLAHKHQAQLERRGVKDAQVSDNPTSVQVTRVRIRAINATTVAELQVLKKDFPQQKVQPCPPEVAP